jgi:hypothetical protein
MASFEFKMKTWTNHGLSPLAAVGTDQANPNADGTIGPGGRYCYHLNGPEQYRPGGGRYQPPSGSRLCLATKDRHAESSIDRLACPCYNVSSSVAISISR